MMKGLIQVEAVVIEMQTAAYALLVVLVLTLVG
jgi:hypothetical protein